MFSLVGNMIKSKIWFRNVFEILHICRGVDNRGKRMFLKTKIVYFDIKIKHINNILISININVDFITNPPKNEL